MPKRTPTRVKANRSTRAPVAPIELREETALRRARAKMNLAAVKVQTATIKEYAQLGTYGAADRGRRNKDWPTKAVSADMAIIPDAPVLNARARQMVRDTWLGEAGVSAFVRNVVGCGVIPIPQARDEKGNLLDDVNRKAMVDFWEWAGDKQWCDAEGDQTFWQKESLAESERVTVGEAFWVWSYEPNRLPNGRVDLSRPVGLKIQDFEPEQLDETIQTYTDPDTREVREVRGGIEVDARGRAVAYHVHTRNPNDYLWRQQLQSQRIDAARVLHYFRKKRVRQKRGATEFAPVLTDMRDSIRGKDGFLTRMVMESYIGMLVKREAAAGPGGVIPGIQPRVSGDAGTTPSGVPTIDFMPGMVADPGPGVTLEPFIPQSPGNGYAPFQTLTLQGVAAGLGLSPGQLTRKNEGNYSAARQDMLEDRKVFEPLQELMAHNLVFAIYRIFFALSVAEGRIAAPGFESNPMRYTAAEYVAPPPTWIDPKAEAEALEKMIAMRVVTREEITHMRGTRLVDVLNKIAAEAKEAKSRGIEFAENADDKTVAFKREAYLGFQKDGMVSDVLANQAGLKDLTREVGIPVNEEYVDPYVPVQADDGQMVSGDVVNAPDGAVVGGNVVTPAGDEGKPKLTPEQFQQQAEAYGIAVRAGTITPNADDEKYFREQVGLPAPNKEVDAAWKDQPTRTPVTIQDNSSSGGPFGGGRPAIPASKPTEQAGVDTAGEQAKAIGKQADAMAAMAAAIKPPRVVALAQADSPNYRLAAADAPVNCGTCRFYLAGKCEAYDFTAAADHVCDAFETAPATGEGRKTIGGTAKEDPDGFEIDSRSDRGVS